MKKYFGINQKSMADALVFLGFNYMKFDDTKYGKVYSFENTDKLRIYQIPNPKLILVITNDKVQVSEYDTLKNVKDSSYIDRVYTFLSNHFDNKYMLSENATGELLAERLIDDIKINLYTIRCQSCTYLYGRSDLAEIIDGDTSYMFRLNIDSSLLKEGIENAEN